MRSSRPLRKVLTAYSSKPPIVEYLKKAFAARGVEAEGFYADENHWFDRLVIRHVNKACHNLRVLPKDKGFFDAHPLSHLNYRSGRLAKKVKAFAPDMVLLIRGIRIKEDALKEIGKNAALLGWWIEREERMEEAFAEINFFDHYFFMNSSCVEEAKKRGFNNVSLLRHAVDTRAFMPLVRKTRYDWSFVGGWSPKRQRFIEKAQEVSGNGAIYGPKWRKKNFFNMAVSRLVKGGYIEGEPLTKLYNESKVVLNVTNWGPGKDRTGLNMRVLEVPACKAFLLTDGSRDIEAVVTPGVHLGLYEGEEEFASKLAYYLKNGKEREAIAEAGYKHVSSNYTYGHVAGILTDKYNEAIRR
ncbi:MAG: glycosyltransferase [Deltaproteobacteria bacterium]|nr:glycosyltransferase [Deltaproteobacteria bacterium]